MMRRLSISICLIASLAACSSNGSAPSTNAGNTPAAPTSTGAAATTTATGDADCAKGVTASDPGVVDVFCGGPANIRIQAGSVTKDLRGGSCHSAGGVWSASVGVVVDVTGAHGAYKGPSVDNIVVNNTTTAGKGTIQAVLGGKHYFVLGTAKLTVSADGKTAHATGKSDPASDAPNAAVVVDVTC
jgi:hypothetical protein